MKAQLNDIHRPVQREAMVRKARDLLSGNETALLIFTDGRNLNLDAPDGEAYTAWWIIAEHRTPDKVIICQKHLEHGRMDVYIADYTRKERRSSDNRFKVFLAHVRHIGTTDTTWAEFAEVAPGAQPYPPPVTSTGIKRGRLPWMGTGPFLFHDQPDH